MSVDFDSARIKIKITEITHFCYKRANKDRWSEPREAREMSNLGAMVTTKKGKILSGWVKLKILNQKVQKII